MKSVQNMTDLECEIIDSPDVGVLTFLGKKPDGEEQEYLRFEPNGDIYVHGRPLAHDHEVYIAIVSWLYNQKCAQCNEAMLQPKKCGFCRGTGLDEHQNKINPYGLTNMCKQCGGAGNVRRL